MSPAPARHARSTRAARRATRRRRRRALWCTTALLCAATALGGLGVYRKLDKNLATTDIGGALGPDRPARTGAALNILVLGFEPGTPSTSSFRLGFGLEPPSRPRPPASASALASASPSASDLAPTRP